MKTTIITPAGNLHAAPLDGGAYRITGHAVPSQTVANDAELMAKLGTVDDGEPCLRLLAKDNATVVLAADNRHGQEGFRGCRYEEIGKAHKLWDEWYLFFPTLREAVELFSQKGETLEAGIQEARRRF